MVCILSGKAWNFISGKHICVCEYLIFCVNAPPFINKLVTILLDKQGPLIILKVHEKPLNGESNFLSIVISIF